MKKIDSLIKQALKEDIGKRDLTTELLVPKDSLVKARIIAQEDGVIAGLKVAEKVFRIQNIGCGKWEVGDGIKFWAKVKDGDKVRKGEVVAEIYGPARTILTAERVALNFLGHLSGIATLTAKYVNAVHPLTTKHYPLTRIYDTRKTTPLWRELEKYAVRCGGGYNHRLNLSEQVLIKDNHLRVSKLGGEQVRKLRKKIPKKIKIEMETENLNQVKEALTAGVDIIMLDNMSLTQMKKAVELVQRSMFNVQRKKPEIEVSGGVNLKNIRKIAQLGVERISIGEITHSAPALDINLEVDFSVK
ncbi:MAG TPA: carboxylating nicotinate-nucleotide diphosphorylase [Elusimicrobia bacterium]|jgi:nicotinate-nucleotide pyrophosphorylase (carboxylating)|nr:carboxylating nicotinate-nucleotide diphosphorylase [Elusimicrobiota bacterium]